MAKNDLEKKIRTAQVMSEAPTAVAAALAVAAANETSSAAG